MLKIISSRGQVVEGMSQLPFGVLPTVIDGDVGNSTSNPNENLDDPELHKPDGEQHLLQVPLMAPSSKRQRTVMQEQQHSSSSTGQFPQNFMVKWVLTENDLVPFVMHKDSKVVYCSKMKIKMQVFTTDGIATVICLKGRHWNCPGHHVGHCGCHCHTLQWHYSTR